jgi:type IV pilus assembly protein PilN
VIRINLLPGKKRGAKATGAAAAASSGGGQGWIVGYVFVALVTCGALAAVYVGYQGRLDEKNRVNSDLRRQIADAQANSALLEDLQAKLTASHDLERVVGELRRAQLGPTRVLMELAKILSEGAHGGPTIDPQRLDDIRRENPLAGYNASWDSRRLWITAFTEENRECKIAGVGRTNEDVAELLARLALSDLFQEVTLERTQSTVDTDTQLPLISFDASCKVIY